MKATTSLYSGGIATHLACGLYFDRLQSLISVMATKNALQTNYRRNDLYVDHSYRDRFRIHIEDTKASMTILTARRSDSGRYKFEIETLNNNKLGGLTSIIEISVHCK